MLATLGFGNTGQHAGINRGTATPALHFKMTGFGRATMILATTNRALVMGLWSGL